MMSRLLALSSLMFSIFFSSLIATTTQSRCDTLPTIHHGPYLTSHVAFISRRDGDLEIYTVLSDGTDLRKLTSNQVDENAFSWSPDGHQMAFASWRDGNGEIYVMNADGSEPVNLSKNSALDYEPLWSPDGNSIAFASDRDGVHGIYRIDLTTGDTYTAMNVPQSQNMLLGWSPDGLTLAYTSTSMMTGGIATYLRDVSGEVKRIFSNRAPYRTLAWIPDGSALTLITEDHTSLELTNISENHTARLFSQSYKSIAFATFSPDGHSLAYIATRDDELTPSLFVSGAYGCEPNELLDSIRDPRSIRWSPDSRQLLLVMGIDLFTEDVYVVNVDGSGFTKLIESGNDFTSPLWQPLQP